MSHRAHLDVPTPTLRAVTAWIATARRSPGHRPWQRAATVHHHVLLVLRWMRHHPSGHPLWVSAVRPGSMDDLRCARELVLPALYPFCRLRPDGQSYLPVLADKGYIGAGIGVRVPHRRPTGGHVLEVNARTYNRLHAALRAPSERAKALLQHWHALDPITLDPWTITKVVAAALVLTRLQLPAR